MKIKKEISALVLSAFVGIFGVTSVEAADLSNVDLSKVQYQQYTYGMKLDVKHVISMSEKSGDCQVVPAKMAYEDSQGNIKGIKYSVFSDICNDEG